ncbi:response regulator [Chitinophaga alhagiae]|uniref:response regulator n=1 Tax=Chitinophaga alhagiae TaxID=2203219 RepID=UPI000E5B4773|nr:response regulator [Chitinophaga alhagiae]
MKPRVVLIIDDDNDDRDFLKEAISEYDPSTIFQECKNGVEAVGLLSNITREEVPDFIFLDLNMPLMNGRQCLRHIRKMDQLADTPVIIYTTSLQPDPTIAPGGAGSVHFLTKPSRLAELRTSVRNILDHNWQKIVQL